MDGLHILYLVSPVSKTIRRQANWVHNSIIHKFNLAIVYSVSFYIWKHVFDLISWAKCHVGNEGKDRRGRNQSLSPFLHHFPAFFPSCHLFELRGKSCWTVFHVPVPTCLNGLNTQQAKRNRSEFTSAWRARDDQPGSSDRKSPVCASRTLLPRCWELFLVWMVFCSLSSLSPTVSLNAGSPLSKRRVTEARGTAPP